MPSGFMALDMGFPRTEGMDTEQKIQAMTDYLMQLLEQLRYTLYNLGEKNINGAEWTKVNNKVVFTALGEEGATVINGGNISTGTIDAGQVAVENIDASNINTGTLDAEVVTVTNLDADNIVTGTLTGRDIRGGNIYGAKYFDFDGVGALDITSDEYHSRLRFGAPNQAYADSSFGIDEYDNGGHQESKMLFFGLEILHRSGIGTTGVEALGDWTFDQDIQLPANSQYPTAAQVQAMIDAALANQGGGA